MPSRSLCPAVLGLVLAACGGGPAPPRRPNVVLVSIDTLRADHVGCYGYERPTTPNVDRFAREGVVFLNHVSSSSWTLPAHAALFTSVADTVHGCVEATGQALAPEFTTLAERFAAAGYRTAGFYAGPYLHEAFGLDQGFGVYDFCVDDGGTFDGADVERWGLDPKAQRRSHQGVTNPAVYGAAREWLQEGDGEPFFLFLHLWDVHYDFTPPAPWNTRFNPGYTGPVTGRDFFFDSSIHAGMPEADREQLVALYDGEIGWTDTFVGRLRDDLEALGLVGDTVVAITSDHGTEFFEHGNKGHRRTLFDEVVRVPLVLWYPARLAGGRRVNEQTRCIDVGPTLLELADLPPPEGVMGHSLVGLASGGPLSFPNDAISELYSVGFALRSVRDLRTKFLLDENDPENLVRWYALEGDPGELRPSDDFSSELGRRAHDNYMRAKTSLEEALASRPGAPVAVEVPAAVEAELRGAGYLGGTDEDE